MDSIQRRRVLFWAPGAALLIIALVWLLRPQAVPVDLATASEGPLQVTITDEGEARVRDVFVMSAPVAGLMRRVVLEPGDIVVANETEIARIEPAVPMFLDERAEAEARAAVDAAEAALSYAQAQARRAEAERDFAQAELRRLKALAKNQSVSQNDLDAAERRAKAAVAAVAEADAMIAMRASELKQARARLLNPSRARRAEKECECIIVRSPISGTVLRVLQESETTIAAGAPILEIGDPRDLEIQVDLLSEEAVRVKPGQRVIVNGWGGDRPLNGVVRRVEPFGFTKISALGIEEQRVNVLIDLTDPYEHWAALGHGYRVEPSIVVWESPSVVRVPLSALFRQDDRWAVFVDDDGTARLREVEVGQQNGLHAQIVSGIRPGERVVVHPNDRIADGTRIEIRTAR
ncbi:MAG TPA: HlyD family efflux transporter periplasmic adaptor subunit [Steroidobacteraceae bacterium]